MAQQWNIGTLLSTSSAYWKGCTLQAGVRLGVFSFLGSEEKTLQEIHKNLDTDERATGLLLDALTAMGLLEKSRNGYRNCETAAEFLVRGSNKYMGNIILHHHHLVDGWARLHEAVEEGHPIEKRSYGEEQEREAFLMGMFNLAMVNAPKIAGVIDLSGKKKLLDLGGGPGTYAIHFCLKNKDLKATIFDRSTTRPFAEKTVERFGLPDRINFAGGDFTTDTITGGPYDVAWLSHILHSNGPQQCRQVIKKTVRAMEPGGLLLVHDFILNNDKSGPEFPALFSLNMLINNPAGRSYSESEIGGFLEESGLGNIQRLDWEGPNDSAVMCGTVL